MSADTTVIFGPQQFNAAKKTAIYVEQFTEPRDPAAEYILYVENGAPDGSSMASNVTIELNGTVVLQPADMDDGGELFPVIVRGLSIYDGANTLVVRVKGSTDLYLVARVLRIVETDNSLYRRRFQKATSVPETFTDEFTVPPAAGSPFWMSVEMGEEGGTFMPDSVRIVLNDEQVFPCTEPCPFPCLSPPCIDPRHLPVQLQAQNELDVWMEGGVATSVIVSFEATDTAAPVIDITSPSEGLVVSVPEVEVMGTVQDESPPVTLTIDGDTVPVSGQGDFSKVVPLTQEGENVILIVARDASWQGELEVDSITGEPIPPGNSAEVARTVIRDTQLPSLTVVSPEDGLVTQDPTVTVSGSADDVTAVTVSVDGLPLPVDGTGSFSGEVALDEGTRILTITATDEAGNQVSEFREVTRDGTPPALTVVEPQDQAIVGGDNVVVSGTVSDATAVTLAANGTPMAVEADGTFAGTIPLESGITMIIVTATDAAGNTSTVTRSIQRSGGDDVPPDPSTVAPPLDPTVATTMLASTEFLYTGDDPIQEGVAPGVIEPVRVSVIRGQVLDREGDPLVGVDVAVKNHPEYGSTRSRADGAFDLAVNGGGRLTINYQKSGYLSVQRHVTVPWQGWAHVENVVLPVADAQVTTVDLSTPAAVQIARGSVTTDADGSRQATVLFKPGVSAEMVLPNGTTQPLTSLSVRATEYTVGQSGLASMPGPLPPTTAYTYAVELSVDEAEAANATSVEFSEPVSFYVENFLGFPIGLPVPVGWWDRDVAAWIPAPDGRIIEILAVTSGLAEIDTDGDGAADDAIALAALGIDEQERQTLAQTYAAGTSLWRVETTHFTPLDLNYPLGLPPGAFGPLFDLLKRSQNCPSTVGGSIIECENQVLGERLGIAGSEFTLNYRSSRTPGMTDNRTIQLPLIGEDVPDGLQRIDIVISVAGQTVYESFSPAPSQSYTFEWDGNDAYGRPVQGEQAATVRVGYVYSFFYGVPANAAESFGLTCSGSATLPGWEACAIPTSVNEFARQQQTLWQEWKVPLGTWDARNQEMGGWTIDVHHAYNPAVGTLHLGTGRKRSTENLNAVISTMAGISDAPCCESFRGFSGDGGPALEAQFNRPRDLAVAPDGSLYIADTGNHRVRRVTPDGIITTVAGSGSPGYSGDGGPATQASFNGPFGVAVGPFGRIYIADRGNSRIRMVEVDGTISTVAGNGIYGYSGDGGPATQAHLGLPQNLAFGPDGGLYFSDTGYGVIRRIGPGGFINTVAGRGTYCDTYSEAPCGDGDVATRAGFYGPLGFDIGPDGSIYVADYNHIVRKVDPTGIVSTVAGRHEEEEFVVEDGLPATEVGLWGPEDIAVGADGSVYIADTGHDRIRRIGPDGILTTVAGSSSCYYPHTGHSSIPEQYDPACGDGGLATRGRLGNFDGVALAPDGTMYVLTNGFFNRFDRVRKVAAIYPGFSGSDVAIASDDGRELYQFDGFGRHLRTLHAVTGAMLYSFEYDAQGRLIEVEDGDGLTTTIERDGGGLATAVVAPFGHRTVLSLDTNRYLTSVSNPAGETVGLDHSTDGLLATFTDPRGHLSEFTYDSEGRLIRDQDAAGGFQALARTENGNAYDVTLTTAEGRTTTYLVEALPAGGTRRARTDPSGLTVESVTGTNGSTTAAYPDGTLTSMIDEADPRLGVQASVASAFTMETPGGRTLSMSAARRVALGDTLDPLSLVSQVDSVVLNGRTFTSLYEASLGRYTETSAEGRQSFVRIDSLGRPIEEQVAGIAAATYTYDSQGFLTQITQGPRTWTYGYDTLGRLASATDPLARTDSMYYDDGDRLVRQVLANGQEIAYDYDTNGNLTSLTPPGRPAHTFTYNTADLDSIYAPPSLSTGSWTTEYRYNLDRQLTDILRPDGQSLAFGYDAAGRLDAISTPQGPYGYTYSGTTGNLTSIAAPGGPTLLYDYDGSLPTEVTWAGSISGSVAVTYDDNLWVTRQTVNGGNAVTFQYDQDGLLTGTGPLTFTRDGQNGLLTGSTLGSVTQAWRYGALGELSADTVRFGGVLLFARSYTRDALGRIEQLSETVEGVAATYSFVYDSIGRLEGVQRDGVPVESYEYDPNGNRLRFTGPLGTVLGTYDAQDRLVSYGDAQYTHTANGERNTKIVGNDTTRYSYDVLGNLRSAVLPDGMVIEYLIDGQNRRVGKKVDGVLVQGFLYGDQLNPVAELDGNGNVVSRFVYGSRTNVPDYMVREGVTYRIVSDHLGSVRLVVDVGTGALLQRIDYDAWGRVLLDTDPGLQPFGYAGGLYDQHTTLQRFGVRDYDAEVGRWTVKDPISFDGGDANLFGYVFEDPVNWTDPDGMACIPCLAAAAVALGELGLSLSDVFDFLRVLGNPCASGSDLLSAGGFALGGIVGPGGGYRRISGYTRHGLNQAISRDRVGVSPKAILDAVRSPQKVVDQVDGTARFIGDKATVVLNQAGQVVTTWARTSLGWRGIPW